MLPSTSTLWACKTASALTSMLPSTVVPSSVQTAPAGMIRSSGTVSPIGTGQASLSALASLEVAVVGVASAGVASAGVLVASLVASAVGVGSALAASAVIVAVGVG